MNGNRRELKKMLRKVIHAWTPPFRDSPTGNPWASRARNTWPLVSRGKDSMTRTPSREAMPTLELEAEVTVAPEFVGARYSTSRPSKRVPRRPRANYTSNRSAVAQLPDRRPPKRNRVTVRSFRIRYMKRVLIALALVGSPCLHAQPSQTMFVFQTRFWLNLHQFLSGEAYRRSVKAAPGLDAATLNASDRAIWISAIDPYNDVFKRNMVLDEDLIRIANALAVTEDAMRLPESLDGALGANIAAALNAAAPIYRAHVWPARQRDNDAWIASAKSLMQGHETAMKAALEAVLQVTWPPEPILVDVVGETGPASAITHNAPTGFVAHTQASAGSPCNTGIAPLRLLFHEATHIPQVAGRIAARINEETERQELQPVPNLWHTLLLFTPGEIAKRELGQTEKVDYARYPFCKLQLTPAEQAAFEQDWQPYLDGKTSFEKALHDLVREAR